jgi:hypothetical protein
MFRFMHIGFHFAGVPKVRDLEPPMTVVGDWIRYSALSWIVWTDKSAADIYLALRGSFDKDDQVLIAKLEMTDCIGSLSPWIWTWINSKVPGVRTGNTMDELLQLLKPTS